jgi:hypothetical protein
VVKIKVCSLTFWVQIGIAVELHNKVNAKFEVCLFILLLLLLLLLSFSKLLQPKMHPRLLPLNCGLGSPSKGQGSRMFKGKLIRSTSNNQNYTKSYIKILDYNVRN